MNTIELTLAVLALMGAGMMAGLFGAFSTFMMKSLAALGDKYGMMAMQSINRVILRASFFSVFFGTGVVLIGLLLLRSNDVWLVAAAMSYLIFCIGVTIVGNVPLNNKLDATDANSPAATAMWNEYLVKWVGWNHIRTIACLLTVGFLAMALVA